MTYTEWYFVVWTTPTVRLGSIHDPAMGTLSIPLSPNRFGYFFAQGILLWVERSLRVRSCESVGCSRRTKPPRQATIDFGPLWCWICWIRFWKFSKSRCRIEQTPRGFERSDVRSSVGIVLPVEHGKHSRGLNFEILNFKLRNLIEVHPILDESWTLLTLKSWILMRS